MGSKDLEIETPLFRDMYIATKFLNRSHVEFLALPEIEKKKLRSYLDIVSKKKRIQIEKMENEVRVQEAKAKSHINFKD